MTRDAIPEDFPEIERIHAEMGSDYSLQDLNSPLFLVKKVEVDDNGKVIGACLLRITAETFLFLDPNISARDKMRAMIELQPAVLSEAYSKGIDDIEARIPETVEKRFYKRLLQLGWRKARPGWSPWSRSTL